MNCSAKINPSYLSPAIYKVLSHYFKSSSGDLERATDAPTSVSLYQARLQTSGRTWSKFDGSDCTRGLRLRRVPALHFAWRSTTTGRRTHARRPSCEHLELGRRATAACPGAAQQQNSASSRVPRWPLRLRSKQIQHRHPQARATMDDATVLPRHRGGFIAGRGGSVFLSTL